MAIQKNFVVKNGLEVSNNLIFANTNSNKVGVGTTAVKHTLHVNGGIGATDFYLTGIGTFVDEFNVGLGGTVLTVLGLGNSIGIGTALPEYLLDIRSPVSTGKTALYVQGDVRITGDLNVDDISLDDVTAQDLIIQETLFVGSGGGSGIATIKQLNVSGLITTNQLITYGISTFRNYARFIDGQQLYFGDGSDLSIYHDGTNSYIQESGTGNLYLQSTAGSINILTNTSESAFVANQNGSVELYHDNAKKFETLSTGSTVTGTFFANQLSLSGVSTLGVTSTTQLTSQNLNISGISTLGVTSTTQLTSQNLNISGISTLGVTSTTQLTSQNLNISGISTLGVTSTTQLTSQNLNISGISTLGVTSTTQLRSQNLNISGISTLGTVRVNAGIITATSGIVTYYGDGSGLINVIASGSGVVVRDNGVLVGTASTIDFGDNLNVTFNAGIATVTGTSTGGSSDFVRTGVGIHTLGNLGIGTTNPTSKLTVQGDVSISGIITAQDFNSLSDINYKTNIESISNSLNIVSNLEGVKFVWKQTGNPSLGVIAQQIEEYLPELVHTSDHKTVNYNGIIAVLIEAVKELSVEVENIKAQLNN